MPICFASENFRPQLAQRRLEAIEIAAKQKVCKDEGSLNAPPGSRGYGNLVQNTSRQASRQAWGCGNWSKTIYNISQRKGPVFGPNKARKGRRANMGPVFDQNEAPKPGPQNRQFCGDAWAYLQSSEHAVDFLRHETLFK